MDRDRRGSRGLPVKQEAIRLLPRSAYALAAGACGGTIVGTGIGIWIVPPCWKNPRPKWFSTIL